MQFTEREAQILEILRNRHVMFAKEGQAMNVSVYLDYYWDELTALSVVAPEYVAYIPPNPKGNPMYETGKHMTLPAIEGFDYAPYKQASASVAQDSAIEAPATDAELQADLDFAAQVYEDDMKAMRDNIRAESEDYSSELEALRKQLADANARIANDAAYMEKLEGDLEAAKAIIIKAGEDFKALKALNAHAAAEIDRLSSIDGFHRRALRTIAEESHNWTPDRMRRFAKFSENPKPEEIAQDIADFKEAMELSKVHLTGKPQVPKEAEALRQPFPKFSVNQKVWILSKRHAYAALGKIISIRQLSNGVNQYELNHVGGYWYNENELEAHEDKSLIPYESDLS